MQLSNMYGHARALIDADYLRIGPHLIHPFDPTRVQPASYDVTLGPKLLLPKIKRDLSYIEGFTRLDLRTRQPAELFDTRVMEDSGHVLYPDECILAATAEMVTCPVDMICSVDGKSTLGRCFLAVHSTAGFIDPGFTGAVTLELTNHGPFQIVLYPGMPIGQLRFTWLGTRVERPYGSPGLGSHYQGSLEVAPPCIDARGKETT